MRVRFPSPALHTKDVVAEPNWGIPVLCLSMFRSMLGPLWATHIHTSGLTLSASEDAQLVPSCSPAVRFSGSSNLTQVGSPQLRARCERAQLRRREETRPVIPGTRRHVGRRDVRPVDHRPTDTDGLARMRLVVVPLIGKWMATTPGLVVRRALRNPSEMAEQAALRRAGPG